MSGSLIALLDDMATLAKVAAAKTTGVVGDDLALNAQQMNGITPERELPVVWAVAKGSFLNKVVLIVLSLVLTAFAPFLITPLLMLGGLYLVAEGGEKIEHELKKRFGASHEEHDEDFLKDGPVLPDGSIDLLALEKDKISGAIKTDFVLSAEIMIIALGSMSGKPLMIQVGGLVLIGIFMTVFVYGLVAFIVKMDDIGEWMMKRNIRGGKMVVEVVPKLMKWLTIAGTVAMFSVGGGILGHSIPFLHELSEGFFGIVIDICVGLVAGGLAVAALHVKSWVSSFFMKGDVK